MRRLVAFGLWLMMACVAVPVLAQTGSIRGVIRDGKDGEKLMGAGVFLIGTKIGGTTDLDGKYEIKDIPVGTYDIRFSFMGYETHVVEGFDIWAGKKHKIDVRLKLLESAVFTIDEIRVTADRVLSTNAAILADRMKAAAIGDAISAEQISKTPGGSSADALKRVTGLSVVDDKFVFVRGVTDRYNTTALNGVTMTGTDTDADKKSFAFDLVPASLLANTVVIKTATPDLPGDFVGGFVQVNTLDFPSERIGVLSLKFGYNNVSTTRPMLIPSGGKRDWLGIDDGSRGFPGRGLTGTELAQALPNTWGVTAEKAPINGRVSVAIGDRFSVWGDDEIGYIAALLYANGHEVNDFTLERNVGGSRTFFFQGKRSKYEVLWGGLANLNYRFSSNHKISFKNNFSQTAEENVLVSAGDAESAGLTRRQTIEWDERWLYLGQLTGNHQLPLFNDLALEWKYHYSDSKASEPDRRSADYSETFLPGVFSLRENSRTWAELNEDSRGAKADLSYQMLRSTKIKVGALTNIRRRAYGIEAWSTDQSTVRSPNYGILTLPIDSIFVADNYGPKKLSFVPMTALTGNYVGESELVAYYGMLDVNLGLLGQRFRVAGGARVEDFQQTVDSENPLIPSENVSSNIDNSDVLPSMNLTYLVTDNANIRLAYSKSVNRPEFREMSNVLYRDFNLDQNVIGNPNLRRAMIENYDVRLEIFPSVDEVLAVSYFHKGLTDAIEEQLVASPERFVRTWFNSEAGENYGFEIEARKSLGFILPLLKNFTASANYTKVTSKIEYKETKTDADGNANTEVKTRPMQGQSPWAVNASLLFEAPSFGMSVNLLYNRIGRRLDAIGDSRDEDVYEESRDLVDLVFAQKLFYNARLKFAISNLGGKDEIFTSGPDASLFAEINKGTTYSLSLSYRF